MSIRTYLVVDACFLDHGDEDVVGLPDNLNTLGGDVSDDSDGNARSWERMTHNQLLRDTQLAAKATDLILEKLPQGLDQLETLLLSFKLVDGHTKVVLQG